MYAFPVEGTGGVLRPIPRSNCETPGQFSITEVFDGQPTSGSLSLAQNCAADASTTTSVAGPSRHRSSSTQAAAGLISVATHDGEALHYPMVQGRAGGNLTPQTHTIEPARSGSSRDSVAARAQRHASVISMSLQNGVHAASGSGLADEAEVRDAYRQSRLTPSSIQRHRQPSLTARNSPPPTVTLRGEAVEDVVRATHSQAVTPFSSLPSTPRHSLVPSPRSNSHAGWGSVTAEAAIGSSSTHLDPRHQLAHEGGQLRVEEVGVSTPEMAEYYAEAVSGGHPRRTSAMMLNSQSNWNVPGSFTMHGSQRASAERAVAAAPPPHSTAPLSADGTQTVLARLMRLMEEQAASMEKLHHRMDSLEKTSKSLLGRVDRMEAVQAGSGAEAISRVSAESASPSVPRNSGSMESSSRPNTRAPSKAVS